MALCDGVRKPNESLDDYINRMIQEENQKNAHEEARMLEANKKREYMAEYFYKQWVNWSGKPLGRKLRAKRAGFFRKFIDASSGNYYMY